MSNFSSEDFTFFISSLLQRTNINNKNLLLITSPNCMKQFELAFTHKTFDNDNNYELIELMGDTIVNYCVVRYLREWDKNIKSIKILTRLKHNIISKKELALMAEKLGFFRFVKVGSELSEKFSRMSDYIKHQNTDYMSLLEDTFEAFMGTLQSVIDENIMSGIGISFCYIFMKTVLDEIKISLESTDILDPKTRFKEICDNKRWKFIDCDITANNKKVPQENSVLITKEIFEPIFNPDDTPKMRENKEGKQEQCQKRYYITEAYGFPLGDKQCKPENKLLLATYKHTTKMESQYKACEFAIQKLKNYKIYEVKIDPYSS